MDFHGWAFNHTQAIFQGNYIHAIVLIQLKKFYLNFPLRILATKNERGKKKTKHISFI